MDELSKVTGDLMTEATTPKRVIGVQSYTRPATIWRAKATLAQITPYRIWIRQGRRRDARTLADARALYLEVVRELHHRGAPSRRNHRHCEEKGGR